MNSSSTMKFFHTKGADFRAIFIDMAPSMNEAIKKISLHPYLTFHFGENVVSALLVAGLHRQAYGEVFHLNSKRYFDPMIVESRGNGVWRGSAKTQPALAKIQEVSDINADLAEAFLHVTRFDSSGKILAKGSIQSQGTSIPDLYAWYLLQSEQVHTHLQVSLQLKDREGGIDIDKAYGLLVEALPGVSENKQFILSDNLSRINNLRKYFETGEKDNLDLLDDIYPGEQWIQSDEVQIRYECGCSVEYYTAKIAALPAEQINEIMNGSDQTVECGFCDQKYLIRYADLKNEL